MFGEQCIEGLQCSTVGDKAVIKVNQPDKLTKFPLRGRQLGENP